MFFARCNISSFVRIFAVLPRRAACANGKVGAYRSIWSLMWITCYRLTYFRGRVNTLVRAHTDFVSGLKSANGQLCCFAAWNTFHFTLCHAVTTTHNGTKVYINFPLVSTEFNTINWTSFTFFMWTTKKIIVATARGRERERGRKSNGNRLSKTKHFGLLLRLRRTISTHICTAWALLKCAPVFVSCYPTWFLYNTEARHTHTQTGN